jgi:hypothetical protein
MPSIVTTAMDWLQNRALQGIVTRLDDHDRTLAGIRRRLNRTERTMSALTDWANAFRAQVNEQTNRISGQLADLQARLDAGDATAVAEVNEALSPIITDLQNMGTGGQPDPLPEIPAEVPTDDSGNVVDESGGGI